MRPSIIFFDEIDGLAPVRSSRQDQIHSSIVSTLLALMDGLDSRGEVVLIGMTLSLLTPLHLVYSAHRSHQQAGEYRPCTQEARQVHGRARLALALVWKGFQSEHFVSIVG